jgi:hypothetical protein
VTDLVAGGGDLEETGGGAYFVSEDLHAGIKGAAKRELLGGASGGGGGGSSSSSNNSIADVSDDFSGDATEKAVDEPFSGDDDDDDEGVRSSRAGPMAKGKPKKLELSELHQSHLAVAKARPRRQLRTSKKKKTAAAKEYRALNSEIERMRGRGEAVLTCTGIKGSGLRDLRCLHSAGLT